MVLLKPPLPSPRRTLTVPSMTTSRLPSPSRSARAPRAPSGQSETVTTFLGLQVVEAEEEIRVAQDVGATVVVDVADDAHRERARDLCVEGAVAASQAKVQGRPGRRAGGVNNRDVGRRSNLRPRRSRRGGRRRTPGRLARRRPSGRRTGRLLARAGTRNRRVPPPPNRGGRRRRSRPTTRGKNFLRSDRSSVDRRGHDDLRTRDGPTA